MSFLSRLEAVGKGVLGLFDAIKSSPLAGLIPGGSFFISIINAVEGTERAAVTFEQTLKTKIPGAAKAQAALPLIKQALLDSELLAGHEVADEALFLAAVQGYNDATVNLLKSIKKK